MMNRRNLFASMAVAMAVAPVVGANAAFGEWLSVDDVIDRLYGLHTSVKLVTHEKYVGDKLGLDADKGFWHLFRVTDAETLDGAFKGKLTSYAAWQPEGQYGIVRLSDLKTDMLRGYDEYMAFKRKQEEGEKHTALIRAGVKVRDIPRTTAGLVYVHGFFGGYDQLSTKPREGMTV